jgi:hypothetical protein
LQFQEGNNADASASSGSMSDNEKKNKDYQKYMQFLEWEEKRQATSPLPKKVSDVVDKAERYTCSLRLPVHAVCVLTCLLFSLPFTHLVIDSVCLTIHNATTQESRTLEIVQAQGTNRRTD